MSKTKRLISIVITICLLLSIIASMDSAALSNPNLIYQKKMDSKLLEMINSNDSNTRISVWVWFTDIDLEAAKKEITRVAGFTEEEFRNSKASPKKNELLKILDSLSNSNLSDTERSRLSRSSREFLQKSEKYDQNLDRRIYNYESIKQNVYSRYYTEHNTKILSELDVQKKDILYKCNVSPSAILSQSIFDIIRIAQSDYVTELYYYDENDKVIEPEVESNSYDFHLYDKNSLHFSDFGFSGTSINVLVIGGNGYAGTYNTDEIQEYHLNNVYNVINHKLYSLSDVDTLPLNISEHAQYVVTVLKKYAPNANVCVVKPLDFENLIWALDYCQIDLMCIAVGYSPQTTYYNTYSKWFDVISQRKHIPVIASAGNGSSQGTCFPYVLAPANGYNSIATGAFTAQENMMNEKLRDYRYNPLSDLYNPKFKPDVVCPNFDTSTAAPALTGILACVLQANHDLRRDPEILKAIVMASCHRKVLPCSDLGDSQETMTAGLTLKQGAGAIDAYRILRIALEETYGYGYLTEDNISFEEDLLSDLSDYSGTLKFNDDLNVSLAWMTKGTVEDGSNINFTFEPVQDLSLEVLNQNNDIFGFSIHNSCKQMVYVTSEVANQTFKIRVNNTTPLANRKNVFFGYAWCEKGDKELSSVEVTYNEAANPTLHAEVTDNAGIVSAINNYEYHWFSSVDGVSWIAEPGDEETYSLNVSDVNKYIKCIVTPLACSLYSSSSIEWTSTNKVLKYGDVDLDGVVTDFDAALIQEYLADLINLSELQSAVADVDLDGSININDVSIIQHYLAGLVPSLPHVA